MIELQEALEKGKAMLRKNAMERFDWLVENARSRNPSTDLYPISTDAIIYASERIADLESSLSSYEQRIRDLELEITEITES